MDLSREVLRMVRMGARSLWTYFFDASKFSVNTSLTREQPIFFGNDAACRARSLARQRRVLQQNRRPTGVILASALEGFVAG